MSKIVAFFLTLPFFVFFVFQPFLSEYIHTRGMVLENVLHKAVKLAAREGKMTPEIKQYAIDELKALHFDESKIQISGTETLSPRGQYIEASVTYPMGPYFIVNFAGVSETRKYYFKAVEMSEYLP